VSAEQVIIADLGLAKALAAASGLTARAGTPGYMAPEQDDPLAVVDRRTDVFGLGQLGVRLLGSPGRRRLDQPVRLRDGVPRRVADVLRSATARRPADRYPDAAALGAALNRATLGPRMNPIGAAAARTAMVLASATLVSILASDSDGRFLSRPGVAVDSTGRISVRLPEGWRAASGRWAGPAKAGGQEDPALVVSPDPVRWGTDPNLPGAFLWLSRSAAAITPTAFVAGRPHADCLPAPVRMSRPGTIDWVIAEYDCADGRGRLVEAAGTGSDDDAALVYVQIASPASSAPAFVDTLLAGVRVR
jgi:hypothetical protein